MRQDTGYYDYWPYRDRPKIEFVVLASLEGGEFAPSGEVSAMQWRAPKRMPPREPAPPCTEP